MVNLEQKFLFKQGKIRNFIESAKYDEIIKKAILNHNRKEIEKAFEKLPTMEMSTEELIRKGLVALGK